MLFTPSTSPFRASAIEGDSSVSVDATSTNGTSDISTRATTPTVGISLPSTIDFTNILPTPSGSTTTATANISITTNDSAGYSLYLYADEDNSLKPVNPANNSSIVATESAVSLDNLTNNTWGYNLSTTTPTNTATYAAVPTNDSTPIQTKDTSTTNSTNDTYTLTFGAKVDTNLPSGTYSNTLTIAVVAEPPAITDITGLTYMQDMTPEVCAETEVGTTATLTDKRDNNTYTIAKLPDGACWMTQNLRLSSWRTLTPEDSNVTRDWTFPTTQLAGNSYSYMYPQTTSSNNVSYGSYYNYCAASAGTVCSQTKLDAFQDICPKGWRLPTLDEMQGIISYTFAFSPIYSGYYVNGSLSSTGSYGYWWSATAYDTNRQYSLSYNSGSLSTSNYDLKGGGNSVRCIRAS